MNTWAGGAQPHLRYVALAVLSSVLWFLSCADFDVWILAWFAMVPLLFVIERVTTTRRAFLFAWLTGTVANGGGFYWIIGMLIRFGHLSWFVSTLLFVVMVAYQGLVFALFGAVTRVIRQRTSWPMAVVAPFVMVTFELAIPTIMPYSVAITQAWQIPVIQVADLAGMSAVTALLLMVSGAIYDLLIMRPRRVQPALWSAAALSAAVLYGYLRMAQIDRVRAAAPRLEIGIVQPNLSFDMKGPDRQAFAERQRRDLQEQSRQLEAEGAELLVWPETAFPYAIQRTTRSDLAPGAKGRVREGFTLPVLFGAVSVAHSTPTGTRTWNSAFLLNTDGSYLGRYDKIHLMPISESFPGYGRSAFIDSVFRGVSSNFQRGDTVKVFALKTTDGRTWRIGPLICFEDIREDLGRAVAALHPNVLINLTNDAWFGDTSEPWEHLALSVFRAVETRTDLVRAVNTGVSAFVDAAGRVTSKTYSVNPLTHPIGADRLRGSVAMLDGGHTVFTAVGNLFAYGCAALTLFGLLVKRSASTTPGLYTVIT